MEDYEGYIKNVFSRTNWQWVMNGGATVSHGWRPESGFLPYRWQGYDEALLLQRVQCANPDEIAGRDNADLIVLGTHGRTGIDHLIFGSTAERVVRSAACPVLTIRMPLSEK